MVPSNTKKVRNLVVFVVVSVLALITFFSSMRSIGTGEVGVVTKFGQVTGRELSEGLSFVAPWGFNNVTHYDVKTQKEQVDNVSAATKDLQDVSATLVLNYQLERGKISQIHQTVGPTFKDKLITPALNEVFKASSAKYTATELITKRPEVKVDVYNQLKDRLNKYGIVVQDISLTNFGFSKAFNDAIEATQVAQQNVIRLQQELEQTKVEAEKKIAEAQGAAEAQRLQQQTLTNELLYKQWIEKWDGHLPTTVTGDSTILSLPTK